mmetsp:Transcript_7295/g.17852  ORF Transcript_7295/g.17852 Transcript_7295/m.17852 type:complete len:925 (+) Transcript_7295:50-2824(+)
MPAPSSSSSSSSTRAFPQQQYQKNNNNNNNNADELKMSQPPPPPPPRTTNDHRRSSSTSTINASHDGSVMKISLHRKTPSLGQYQSTSIDKHFALSQQILLAFHQHYQNPQTKTVAFFLGVNFLETVLLQIPLHGYFYSTKAARDRQRATVDAIDVLNKLDNLIADDPKNLSKERLRVEKLMFLVEKLQSNEPTAGPKLYEPHRAAVESTINQLYPPPHPSSSKRRQDNTNGTADSRRRLRRTGQSRNRSSNSSTKSPSLSSSIADCDVLACGESLSSIFCPAMYGSTSTSSSSSALARPFTKDGMVDTCKNMNSNSHQFPPHGQIGHRQEESLAAGRTNDGAYPDPTPNMTENTRTIYNDRNDNNTINNSSLFPPTHKIPPSYDDLFPPHTTRAGFTRKDTSVENGMPIHTTSRHSDTKRTRIDGIQTGIPLQHKDNRMPVDPPARPVSSSRSSKSTPFEQKKDLQRALYLSGLEVMPNFDTDLDDDDDHHHAHYQHHYDDLEKEQYYGDDSNNHNKSYYNDGSASSLLDWYSDKSKEQHDVGRIEERDAPVDNYRFMENNSVDEKQIDVEPPENSGVSIDLLKQCYMEDIETLLEDKRVIISEVPTYQGRVEGSTNGCTVIAPLMCINHFHNNANLVNMPHEDNGLTDEEIANVIDKEATSILPTIRQQLGLVQDAFLIPADANEALMDLKLLSSDNFSNVFGGNILDDKHVDPFLETISKVGEKKLAATLFFHEHVVSILQLSRSSGVWFDFIDSLPRPSTLLCPSGSKPQSEVSLSVPSSRASSRSSSVIFSTPQEQQDCELLSQRSNLMEQSHLMSRNMLSTRTAGGFSHSESSGFESDWDDSEIQQALIESCQAESSASQHAIRIRCSDVEALKATIKWYACNAFSEENASYIDQYEWDEGQYDFDPRVFQAFLWTSV